MSRVNRANAALQAHVMQEMLAASCEIGLSGRLQEAAAELDTPESLNRTIAVLREPGVAELAEQIGQSVALSSVLANSRAGATLTAVAPLLMAIDRHVGRLERDVTARLLATALVDEGFTVNEESGEVATGIEAFRGDEIFLAAVQDHGELVVDQAGATDCEGNLARVGSRMADAGAPLVHVTEVEHDRDDAPLIAQAAAAGEANLAAGLARHATRAGLSDSSRAVTKGRGKAGSVARLRGGTQ